MGVRVLPEEKGGADDMRKKHERPVWYYLSFVGQLGFALVTPVVLAAACAYWLAQRFGLGGWVVILGILFGLGGAAVSFLKVVRVMTGKPHGQEDEDA